MIVLIDNYDSFTYNLVQRLGEIDPGIDLRVVRNDQVNRIIASGCSIITRPSVITMQAAISMRPRRSQVGHFLVSTFICGRLRT